MAVSASCPRSLANAFKRLKISPNTATPVAHHLRRTLHNSAPTASPTTSVSELSEREISAALSTIRLPKAVQATYLAPLRRTPTHNITVADLQLRSYSVRNLELYSDFAMRAAYYLNLPAKGPTPIRRIVERWTVPRSNFVHKKSQENFERKTLRRWIRIVDGHPETVAVWLAFLRKHQYYGVGMKAAVYEDGSLDVAEEMEKALFAGEANAISGEGEAGQEVEPRHKELYKTIAPGPFTTKEALFDAPFKAAYGAMAPMGGATTSKSLQNAMPILKVEEAERVQEEKDIVQIKAKMEKERKEKEKGGLGGARGRR